MRRVGVVLLLVALAAALLGIGAAPAHASEAPIATQPYNLASDADLMTALRTSQTSTDMTTFEATFAGESAVAQKGASRAAMAARVLPAMRVLGTIGLGVTAAEVGWKIGSSIYTHFIAPSGPSAGSLVTGATWEWKTAQTNYLPGGGDSGAGWMLKLEIGSSGTCTLGSSRFRYPPDPYTGSPSGCPSIASYIGEIATKAASVASYGTLYPAANGRTVADEYGWSAGSQVTRTITQTDDGLAAATGLSPISSTAYNALPAPQRLTSSYTEPTHTTADATAARASLTAGTKEARDYINWILDPTYEPIPDTFSMPSCVGQAQSYCTTALGTAGHTGTITYTAATTATANPAYPPGAVIIQPYTTGTSHPLTTGLTFTVNPAAADMPFTFPAPLYGESAEDYRDRLVTAGLLGTITLTPLSEDAAIPQLGRSAVTRVRVGTQTLTVARPTTSPFPASGTAVSPWTQPSPTPAADTDVEIEHNPDTLPDYGDVPGSGDDDCPCPIPAVDFSPLSEISTGTTFPFGLFTFLGDVLDHFNVTPEPPGWSFNLGTDAVGHYDYDWDLSAFSTYMAIVRSLISVALWIGAVWLLATRLLGFHAGGDLTEAADDGSVI